MIRYIGESVRHYSLEHGWTFGTVRDVHPPKHGAGLETATVFFPGREPKFGRPGYVTRTVVIASFLLEHCDS